MKRFLITAIPITLIATSNALPQIIYPSGDDLLRSANVIAVVSTDGEGMPEQKIRSGGGQGKITIADMPLVHVNVFEPDCRTEAVIKGSLPKVFRMSRRQFGRCQFSFRSQARYLVFLNRNSMGDCVLLGWKEISESGEVLQPNELDAESLKNRVKQIESKLSVRAKVVGIALSNDELGDDVRRTSAEARIVVTFEVVEDHAILQLTKGQMIRYAVEEVEAVLGKSVVETLGTEFLLRESGRISKLDGFCDLIVKAAD